MNLPLAEFADNNGYQASIGMAPFEAFRSPSYWTNVGEDQIIGPDIVHETIEKIRLVQKRLKAT